MIYAAYAGTGKSYFCQEHPEAIDLICMPFKYTNLPEIYGSIESDRKGEQVKAKRYLSHKSNGKEFCPDLVLKYARKYAEVCRKKSLSENMLEEAKKPEDIML